MSHGPRKLGGGFSGKVGNILSIYNYLTIKKKDHTYILRGGKEAQMRIYNIRRRYHIRRNGGIGKLNIGVVVVD